ncbi:caffeoylshikimate esterase-like isoform X1 [Coffea arabica]|uniref:Caffeoylshikimate esterase-like isoform X1 n=1 Tax=Coffea arabica TaxID=13443 RepID=A0ABM4VS82_COFAR
MSLHPVAEANEKSPFGSLTPEEFYARHKVTHGTEFITNPRGLKLFTQWWIPLPDSAKPLFGVVCVVHGFTCESSWFVQLTSVHLAKQGFAVCAIDHQGHGFSEGLQAHVPDINPVVDDCAAFFDDFRERHAPPDWPTFLYSESLGGAIALLITLRKDLKRPYDGIVLNGAMCGVSDKFKPPWPLEHFLPIVAAVVPTWPVIPTRGRIPEVSFKMAAASQGFPNVQDDYLELEEELNRLTILGGACFPMGNSCHNRQAEPLARAQANSILLKNEIYDLFKQFYRHESWGFVLDSALVSGRSLPMLQLIASRMKADVEEQMLRQPISPSLESSHSFYSQND